MKKIVALAAVAALFTSTSIAGAAGLAEITSSSGKVLVNQGAGFVPVAGMMSLNVGDSVMVGEGAQAQISYAAGCTVTAGSASVTTISDVAPCQAGEAIGSVGAVFVQPTADADYSPAALGIPLLPLLLIGGAVVGGGILIGTGVLGDGGNGGGASAPAA
jgi:hypothetical protein